MRSRSANRRHRRQHQAAARNNRGCFGTILFSEMARVTGLEPATSGVTGRRSNQLSYTRVFGVAAN